LEDFMASFMNKQFMLSGLLAASLLSLPLCAGADTQPTAHRVHKVKKQQPPPPLPSGTRGPVPQVPLDAMPAVPPQVSYQDGLLTIVAPNSTLSEILKGVRKHTAADIEIPTNASERVATHLGPGPARDVMSQLLNGSHFNYILLGSPNDSRQLVRVVLVAKTGPDNPPNAQPAVAADNNATEAAADNEPDAASEDNSDDGTDPAATAEAEQQQQVAPDQTGGVKTPQQMLQEMQQRQLQMQQQMQQQQQQQLQLQQQTGRPPIYPPNGMPTPQPPQQQQ
jgi:hypothetical protein